MLCHTCGGDILDWQARKEFLGKDCNGQEMRATSHYYFEDCLRHRPDMKAKRVDIWCGGEPRPEEIREA